MDDFLDENYAKFLPTSKESKILDLGCGEGRLLRYLSARGYKNVVGVDRNPTRIPTVIVESADSYLKKNPKQFDLILMKDMLYYTPREQIEGALKLVREALRPGGKVVIEVFNGAAFTSPFVMYKDHGIQNIFTEQSILWALRDAGFSSIKILGLRIPVHNVKQWILNSTRKLWELFLRVIFLIERGLNEQNPRIFTPKLLAVAEP